jgi:hypothetical protein
MTHQLLLLLLPALPLLPCGCCCCCHMLLQLACHHPLTAICRQVSPQQPVGAADDCSVLAAAAVAAATAAAVAAADARCTEHCCEGLLEGLGACAAKQEGNELTMIMGSCALLLCRASQAATGLCQATKQHINTCAVQVSRAVASPGPPAHYTPALRQETARTSRSTVTAWPSHAIEQLGLHVSLLHLLLAIHCPLCISLGLLCWFHFRIFTLNTAMDVCQAPFSTTPHAAQSLLLTWPHTYRAGQCPCRSAAYAPRSASLHWCTRSRSSSSAASPQALSPGPPASPAPAAAAAAAAPVLALPCAARSEGGRGPAGCCHCRSAC